MKKKKVILLRSVALILSVVMLAMSLQLTAVAVESMYTLSQEEQGKGKRHIHNARS